MENKKDVCLKISLDDSQGTSYFFYEEKMSIKIINWEFKIFLIDFFHVKTFKDWQRPEQISQIQEYELDGNLKKIIISDKLGRPCFEIICKQLKCLTLDEQSSNLQSYDLGRNYERLS